MKDTIGAVMQVCRHYFPVDWKDTEWTLLQGVLSPGMPDGLIAISGSANHNGVWMVKDGRIAAEADEEWKGRIWVLAPPADFMALCAEIDAWREKHPVQAIKSERFGEYGYEAASGKNGNPLGWQDAFAQRLQPYRRMYAEVELNR